ncbi:hypothetical protein TNCV_4993451 [Trichonephila clavipes]|nr:hypothetical protein TNCV_4993451 [Trichonephila clavipes]
MRRMKTRSTTKKRTTGSSNAGTFSALETAMDWYDQQSRVLSYSTTSAQKKKELETLQRKTEGVQWYSEKLIDYLTPSFPLLTDDIVSWVFIESSGLEQVVAIHPGMTAERASLVSSQVSE